MTNRVRSAWGSCLVLRRPALAGPFFTCFVLLFTSWPAHAQDYQLVAVGNGFPNSQCVVRGPNNQLDSTPSGDDAISGTDILSGPNGICESLLSGDDVRPPNGVILGQGAPGGPIITAGIPNSNNGICDTAVTAAGDDVIVLLPGTSTPRQLGVRRGPNGVVNSTPAGDDVATSLICPGGDLVLQSTPSGDDVIVVNSTLCINACSQTQACIIPGADDVLDSTVDVSDESRSYVSTGNDGIANTTAAGDDEQLITVANGLVNSACVHAGPDGIAQTSLCGTGTVDFNEDCDTGGVSASCDADCTFAECGDGTVNTLAGEQCDDAGESASCDANCTFVSCGDGDTNTTAGEECDDGGGNSNSTPDACRTDCSLPSCGDSVIDPGFGEQCDDGPGNSDTTPDACRSDCRTASCGDGVVDPSNSEQCDDGDSKNNDDCVLGCVDASCGDGFRHTKGTPPFESCDDGNNTPGDGCSATCTAEVPAECGNGVIDLACTAGLVGNSCTTNVDCDSAPASGDGVCTPEECDDGNNTDKDDCRITCNTAVCGDGAVKTKGTPPFEECDDGNLNSGDGCSSTCVQECGNAVIDGACSQGTVSAYCNTNVDCDSAPASGDGICATEACDWAISGLCVPGPNPCSGVCTVATCGNEEVECGEQCDLGISNGVAGSGCTAGCERNLVGSKELTGTLECPGAWTLDSAPEDLRRKRQTCHDGDACDFDAGVNGQCVFSVGICVNRGDPAGCAQGSVFAIDVLRLRTGVPYQAAAAEVLTDALGDLTSDSFDAPGRCRAGKKRKNCSINTDCDTFLGAGDGICDVATGVSYSPSLVATGVGANQVSACTPGQPVAVPAGERLKLRLYVRRDDGLRGDKDSLKLVCEP